MNPIWASSLATTHFSQNISIKDFNWRCSLPNLYFRKIILKTVYRIDYVHFKDKIGSALNKDGSWKEGYYDLSKKEIEYLRKNGWNINE